MQLEVIDGLAMKAEVSRVMDYGGRYNSKQVKMSSWGMEMEKYNWRVPV